MSRKYKFHNKSGLYFVSFATVNWISVFIREQYFEGLTETLKFSQEHKGMEIFGYCIMPNHMHLIFRSEHKHPVEVLREYKTYTARRMLETIRKNVRESRKEWMLSMMRGFAENNSQTRNYQFWQHHNKPVQLWSDKVINQKLNYIHLNPVKAGFVQEPHHWKYSSAVNYAGEKGVIEVSLLGLTMHHAGAWR